jgi:hypothetical protein
MRIVMTKPVFALLLLAACGDNQQLPDASVADSSVDAPPPRPRAIVVAGDFVPGHPGVLSVVDLDTRTITTNVGPAMAIGEDPIVRKLGDELFVVNRASGNNVTILDAGSLTLVEQLGTGASSNPQDVAVIGDKLFVATLGNKGAVVLTRGTTSIAELDLSQDDPDGKPNCNSIMVAGGALYVSCGLLDDTDPYLPPRGPGKVYVVDPGTLQVRSTLTLTTNNPIALLEELPATAPHAGDLVLPTIDFGTGLGCIERIAVGATPTAAGCMIDNTALGTFAFASRVSFFAPAFTGPAARIVPTPLMFVGVSSYPDGKVVGYNLDDGIMFDAPVTPMAQVIADIATCPGGELVVADNPPPPSTAPSGLRIYQGTTEHTTAPLAVGLRPSSSHGILCY